MDEVATPQRGRALGVKIHWRLYYFLGMGNCPLVSQRWLAVESLEKQVELERKEIDDAPKVPVAQFQPRAHGESGRCGWCGQWADDLVIAETNPISGVVRYKGVKCCGGRHL